VVEFADRRSGEKTELQIEDTAEDVVSLVIAGR
jgi:hypothetical protein